MQSMDSPTTGLCPVGYMVLNNALCTTSEYIRHLGKVNYTINILADTLTGGGANACTGKASRGPIR